MLRIVVRDEIVEELLQVLVNWRSGHSRLQPGLIRVSSKEFQPHQHDVTQDTFALNALNLVVSSFGNEQDSWEELTVGERVGTRVLGGTTTVGSNALSTGPNQQCPIQLRGVRPTID